MNALDFSDVQSGKRSFTDASLKHTSSGPFPRFKRPKSSKACNACRRQKSRCERLAGDSEGCHRCGVIGIPCIFDPETQSTEPVRTRKPRPILPRNQGGPSRLGPESLDNSRLHVLANTTELVSREARSASSHSQPFHTASQTPSSPSTTSSSTIPLSPETLSTVESALFPMPDDHTSGSEYARFRADWERWIAPLTLLQTLMRKSAEADSHWRQTYHPPDGVVLSSAEEAQLKKHFLVKYSPLLPTVRLGRSGNLDDVSPFLSAVIHATAARTIGGNLLQLTMDRLRGLAFHHIGQVITNTLEHPLVESLYALLILILWPLDAAYHVNLLVHCAKKLASDGKVGGVFSRTNGPPPQEHIDHLRLWHAICTSETILSLGAGNTITSSGVNNFISALGTGSQIALRGGPTSDVLLALQISLHNITIMAMGERPFPSNKNLNGQHTRNAIYTYIRTVTIYLTKLDEWEIEFYDIAGECNPKEAVDFAMLELEYHYFMLLLLTHANLTLSVACPIFSAPDDIKSTVWSWAVTGNKSAHSIIRLFNAHSLGDPHNESGRLPPLAVAPDRIFAMVVIAIMLVLRHEVAVTEYARRRGHTEAPAAGFTRQAENAIRRAVKRMRLLGPAKGASTLYHHPAGRYSEILEALLRIWDEKFAQKVASLGTGGTHRSVGDGFRPRTQATGSPATMTGSEGVGTNGGMNAHLTEMHEGNPGMVQLDMDLSLFGGDLLSDAAAAFTWEGLEGYSWTPGHL